MTCPSCNAATHRPPAKGQFRCFNCGHEWAEIVIPPPPPPPVAATSTIDELVVALRARGARLVLEPGPRGVLVAVEAGGVSRTLTADADGATVAAAVAQLDLILATLGGQ